MRKRNDSTHSQTHRSGKVLIAVVGAGLAAFLVGCSSGAGSTVAPNVPKLIPPVEASDPTAETFWRALQVTGDEVEGFGTLAEMRAGSDAVVTGKFTSFGLSRVLVDPEAPEDVTVYLVGNFAVADKLSGTDLPTAVPVEFLLPGPTAKTAAKAALTLGKLFPKGEMMLFLRNKGGAESQFYRTVNSLGLWTVSDAGKVDTPLFQASDDGKSGKDIYSAELGSLTSVSDLSSTVKGLLPR